MKMKTMKLSALAFAALMIGLISCEKDKDKTPVNTKISVTDSIEVPFSSNKYIFYSFKDSSIISNSDSATNKWDFGMRFITFIVNSNASGPGNGGVIVQSGSYDSFTSAPESGYAYDTTTTNLAINSKLGTPGCWLLYDNVNHIPIPVAGQFFVFKTADGRYVKMEITSISYAGFTSQNSPPTTIIYKFRYTYQADGSRNF